MTKDLTIEQKLFQIFKEIKNVEKDSTNKFHHYDYVSANKLFELIKPRLIEHSLMILPRKVHSLTVVDGLTTFVMGYQLVDVSSAEVLDLEIVGQGHDKGDKGAYKGQTGALKYLILQMFLISTDDDPECDGDERKERSKVSKSDTPSRSSREERSSHRSRKSNDSSDMEGSDKEDSSETDPWLWQIEFEENIYCGRHLFEVPLEELEEMAEEFDEVFTKNDAFYVKLALSIGWKKQREKTIKRWRDSQHKERQAEINQRDVELPEFLK